MQHVHCTPTHSASACHKQAKIDFVKIRMGKLKFFLHAHQQQCWHIHLFEFIICLNHFDKSSFVEHIQCVKIRIKIKNGKRFAMHRTNVKMIFNIKRSAG